MKRFNLMGKDPLNTMVSGTKSSLLKGKDLELLVSVLPIILALAYVFFSVTQHGPNIAVNEEPTLAKRLEVLKSKYDNLVNSTGTNSDTLIDKRNKLRDKVSRIQALGAERAVPFNLLLSLGQTISEKLAITVVNKKDKNVLIDGIAQDNESISDFILSLKSKGVFKKVDLMVSKYTDES